MANRGSTMLGYGSNEVQGWGFGVGVGWGCLVNQKVPRELNADKTFPVFVTKMMKG